MIDIADEKQAPTRAPVSFQPRLRLPAVAPVVVGSATADAARAVIGPDHPAYAIAVVAARRGIIGRVIAPVDEVPSVMERAVIGIAMHAVTAETISTAAIDMRRAEATTMVGAETSAVNGAAAKTTAATATKTAAAVMAAAAAIAGHFVDVREWR